MSITTVAVLVFIINLPFGYFRRKSERFSKEWFIFVHTPIPFVIILRIVSGLGFQLYTFPIMITAFFLGQFFGGMLFVYNCKIRRRECISQSQEQDD